MALPPTDREIHRKVDSFLTSHKAHSINTVVNTIFPASLYRRYGGDEVLNRFGMLSEKIRQHSDCSWGTYALRMAHSNPRSIQLQ